MNDAFAIGDFVEIICHDGASFAGWLQDFTPWYTTIDGRGYPNEDIRLMTHA